MRGDYLSLFLAVGRVLSALFIVVLSAATYIRNADWTDELSIFHDAVRKSPNKVRPYYRLGIEYGRQKDVSQAFRYFKKAQELDPEIIAQWVFPSEGKNEAIADVAATDDYLRANADRKPNKSKEINSSFNSLDPSHTMLLVASYLQQGNYDQAQRLIDDVLASDPAYTDAYLARAEIERRLGRMSNVIDAYNMAIKRGKNAPPKDMAYIGLGAILGQQGMYEESVALFKEAIKIRPSVEAYNNLSVSYRNMGKIDAAIKEQENARMLSRHGPTR